MAADEHEVEEVGRESNSVQKNGFDSCSSLVFLCHKERY